MHLQTLRENIYVVKTLREFVYVDEDGKDQGSNGEVEPHTPGQQLLQVGVWDQAGTILLYSRSPILFLAFHIQYARRPKTSPTCSWTIRAYESSAARGAI